MPVYKLLFLCSALFLFGACWKETPYLPGDRIIFGRHGAECMGNCSRMYKLSEQQLLEDDCNYCPFDNIPFKRQPLPAEKFEIARPLLENIPSQLFDIQSVRYACPGCDDGPAYFMEITRDGRTHQFHWDGYFREVPVDIKPFFEEVVSVLEQL